MPGTGSSSSPARILAAVGLLPLVPLVAERAHGSVRRAAHGALAVLSAALVAAVGGGSVPFADESAGSLGIEPLTPVPDAGRRRLDLAARPSGDDAGGDLGRGGLRGPARGAPLASRFGVVGIGFVLVAASVLAGAGVASTFVCLAAWAIAGLSAGLLRRVS